MIKRTIISIFSSIFIYKIFFALNENNCEIFDYNNNDKIKVSILIPVYNYEQYLRDCLDSVINQSLKNIQIICVDDGSTDNSGKILDEYAQKDKRIIVKHIKHVSIAETRNECLKYATGEYIGFVDADDFIFYKQFEIAYIYANKDNVDILEFKKYEFNKGTKLDDTYHIINLNDKPLSDLKENWHFIQNENWNKIYRTELIKKNNITFTPNTYAEDLQFNYKVIPFIKKIKFISMKSYFFRKKTREEYRKIFKNPFDNYEKFFIDIINFYKEIGLLEKDPVWSIELLIVLFEKLFRNKIKIKKYLEGFFNILNQQKDFINKENIKKINKNTRKLLNLFLKYYSNECKSIKFKKDFEKYYS